jgi:phosphate transport system permease protein
MSDTQQELFPQGNEVQAQVLSRRRRGSAWRFLFLAALALAIIVLMILIVTIINKSFGLVAEESEIPEHELVLIFNESQMLNASNIVLASEDDQGLADGVRSDANGLGFFPHAFYQSNPEGLNLVAVNGLLPTAETVASDEYPGARPLLLYSTATILEEKPQVAAFIIYYLEHLNSVVGEVGYFPANEALLAEQAQEIAMALGVETLPVIDPAQVEGDIVISGSSTVFPLTQAIAERFKADGFAGNIEVQSTGTTAGFRAFCVDNENIDVVGASRPVLPTEFAACSANGRRLEDFLVANDGLVVAVNSANDFVTDITQEQLLHLFTDATTWADVNSEWPAEPIMRYIPSAESGTMDFFVEEAFGVQTLEDLPYDGLVELLVANVSFGRCRALERQQRFYADRLVCETEEVFEEVCASDTPAPACTAEPYDAASLTQLIRSDVVQPQVQQTWTLLDSLRNREEIILTASQEHPNAVVFFRSWISRSFVTSPQSSVPEIAGVRTAILGSLWVVGIAILFSFPLGVGAAIYLEEYADRTNRFNQIIQTNINNLAGVPSIIYGILGLAVFVRALEPITSGTAFGLADPATANGRTILSAGLTLGLLGLPVIIISSQEAIRAVPNSLRQASYGLGATRWQTIWHHVLPNAIAGILTGVILSMSRIIGETAPLVVVGASTFITTDPTGPFSKFTALPNQIYQWTARPQDTFRNIAAAAIVVLITLLLALNATAIYLRNRYSRRMS